ncbi:hypothetical protein [Microbacterium sp. Leaf288]|uniref:hypothetical protein n=1 Tax=Microbacterium sp. Leaf288 TaxID=1736323 RepID=UPI0012FC5CD6|nr:hypothetical protein [Microbacterium sp. Leaf288]
MRTRVTAAVLSGMLVLGLAGCTQPEPAEPTPTTAFSSDEEAFAAAEETYRAYVDALNQVDLSDPETFEAVYGWTTGEANAGARKTFSQMHADGWAVDGPTTVALLLPTEVQPSRNEVALDVCLDVSAVTVVDSQGASVVADDRRDIQSMRITVEQAKSSPTGFLIALIDGRTDGPECAS